MSKIAFVKVKQEKDGVQKAVKRAMELTSWKKYVTGNKIFLKINGISDQLVPGQCTSPWVVETVLKEVKMEFPKAEIKMGDADLAAAKQLNRAAKLWGILDIAEKYNAEFVNISDEETIMQNINGKILKRMLVSKSVLEADTIINLPILKSHCLTKLTCCLKNHWGLIPRGVRHNYHPLVNQVIGDINNYFKKTTYNLVDGTITMEGDAPRTGIPKITNVIFAGNDRVAIDTMAAKFMCLDPRKIDHIKFSEKMGVGSMKYEVIGDKFFTDKFVKARPNKQPIFLLEMNFRKVPILKEIIFKTKFFDVFAWGTRQYNSVIWYNSKGKKMAENVIYNTWYGQEFEKLWNRTGKTGKLPSNKF